MPADIFVYAIVAAGLVFWLRSILGTRHGEERERPSAYNAPDGPIDGTAEVVPGEEKIMSAQDRIIELAKTPASNMAVDNKSAENGLIDISKADKSFDIKDFLTNAQDAFAIVVEAFANNDRDTLKDLLNEDVYAAFDGAISAREKAGETVVAEILSIKEAKVLSATLNNKAALVTLRFVATESRVTKDKADEIIDGHPDKISEMIDIWTFGRDIKSKDPRWFVMETRSDDPDDNDFVPDTH